MKEQEPNWFSNWDQYLPNPEDLIPLSQTLITPDLATAFGIITTTPHNQQQPPSLSAPNSGEFDSSELGGDEPNRTLKRPRLVWTPQLHKKFVDAVAYLGIKNAVPKTIMQLMSVDGLTRENVASHLQKYRLYLKRMQGFSSGASGDAATDRLFASQPVPAHFLQQMHPGFENMVPYVPVGVLQQQQHQLQQQQMVGGYVNRQFGLARQGSQPVGMATVRNGYVGGDQECGNEKRALTLFPTGDE